MIQEDTPPAPGTAGPPANEPPDTFDAAIGAAATLVMALSSAIAEVAFADAARLRTELEQAMSRATSLGARLSDRAARAKALRQLGEMRRVAIRMFQIAPAPSAAAIAAAESGDRAAWLREEQAWIADRLARGTNPRIPRLRRQRRDTRPDSPKALRLTSGDDASGGPAPAAHPSVDDEDPR